MIFHDIFFGDGGFFLMINDDNDEDWARLKSRRLLHTPERMDPLYWVYWDLITVRDLWKCLNHTVLGLQVKHSRTTEVWVCFSMSKFGIVLFAVSI